MTDLARVVGEIPTFCDQIQSQRGRAGSADIDFEQYFEFNRYLGQTKEYIDTPSKSDVVSMPGLTSGTSEDGGSSPLPLPEDRARARARLADAKKQDDELTIPRREIRPKGNPQYPAYLQVFGGGDDGVANMTDDSRDSPSSDGARWSSSSGGNSPFTEAGSSETSKPDRGKRNGPLSDREAVAEVRELGACVRCRIRKLKCNNQETCDKCTTHAQNHSGSATPLLGRHLCFRGKLSDIGLAFDGVSEPGNTSHGGLCGQWKWHIFFENAIMAPYQEISVLAQQNGQFMFGVDHAAGQDLCLSLNKHELPDSRSLVNWSAYHAESKGVNDLQSALDAFVFSYCVRLQLPQIDMVTKMHTLRCMYRIWKTKSLYYCAVPSQTVGILPESIHREIKGIARSTMKSAERDILSSIDRFLKTPMQKYEKLPIWVCMIQLILTYRDLIGDMESDLALQAATGAMSETVSQSRINGVKHLFVALVIMFEGFFKNKPLDIPAEKAEAIPRGRPWNDYLPAELNTIDIQIQQFASTISQESKSVDYVLTALRPKKPKRSQAQTRQPKRQKVVA